jgi:hypothetical protein
MGIIGFPQEITIELAKLNNSKVFIETGTLHGGTTRWAANHFDSVHTIERAENLYDLHSSELAQIPAVTPHLGDSRQILPHILAQMGQQRCVFWLDGHWSGGETAGAEDECPLLDELACLSGRQDDIILIDDARLFLCVPPQPHNPAQWPTIAEIISALPVSTQAPFVQVVDDVIFIIPSHERLKQCLVNYAQTRANLFWTQFGQAQMEQASFGNRLKRRITQLIRPLTA